jgi:GNAT superfamily N-acetyltransferase
MGVLMMDTWMAKQVTDKAQILAYLQTDRLYAAYAIGDLEPSLYAQSSWAVAESGGQWRAVALHFRGLQLPALFVMGDPDGVRAILERAMYPARAYLTCRAEHLAVMHASYVWDEPTAMWRMALHPDRFRAVSGPCVRLGPGDAGALAELYAYGGGGAFSPAQLAQGVFYGVRKADGGLAEDRIVAVAGTHLVSEAYGVAAVGNVFTHPDHRGRGYATITTRAVVAELLARGIHDVILNVSQANAAAQRVYEKLGFARGGAFYEGPAQALRA